MAENPSTVVAVRDYMGMTTAETRKEWASLDDKDKADYSNMLKTVGVETKDNAKLNAKAAALATAETQFKVACGPGSNASE